MDHGSEKAEIPTLGDLPVCCHTTRYERFFLLSLDLRVDGEEAKLNGLNSGRLYLSAPQQQSWQIPCETLLTWADEIGKEYGVGRAARLCCGRQPMVEVDFQSKNAIVTFLESIRDGKFQADLQGRLKKLMKSESSSVSLQVRLYLSIPLGDGDASLREVTLTNLETCVKTLKAGNKLDYRNLLSQDQLRHQKQTPDSEADYLSLFNEIVNVAEWFTLGLYLKLPPSELQKINNDFRFNCKPALQEVLSLWLKSGHATWSSLVRALSKMGLRSLGNDIVMRKGIPVDDVETDTEEGHGPELPQVVLAQQRSLEEKEQTLTDTGRRVDQVVGRHKLLQVKLSQLQESSEEVAIEAAELYRTKKDLEISLAIKKERHRRLLDQMPLMTDVQLMMQIVDEVQLSIDDIEMHIALLKLRMERQRKREKELKEEISIKQKELEDSNQALQALKKKHSLLQSKLNAERMVFDFKLREQQQSNEKIQEELEAQITLLKRELSEKNLSGHQADLLMVTLTRAQQLLQQRKEKKEQLLKQCNEEQQQYPEQAEKQCELKQKEQLLKQEDQMHRKEPEEQPEQLNQQRRKKQEQQPKEEEQQQPHCNVNKIKVILPAMFCAGREEKVKVTAKGKEVDLCLTAKLTSIGQVISQAVPISRSEKDRSYLLSVQPKEEGDHLLFVSACGQHIPNSPFVLPVSNRHYYRTTFKQPIQTMDMDSPVHIAFSSIGDMFVTSASTHSIHVYDKQCQKKMEIGKQGDGILEFNFPCGIATRGDMVYVADRYNHRVQKFSTEGIFLGFFGSCGLGNRELENPTGLTIGPDGTVFVSDYGNNRVVVFSEIGVFLRNINVSAAVQGPLGLACSSNGNLHVAGYNSNNYAVFSPAGKLVRSHKFADATDMAMDAAGFVFAACKADESNSLSIFNPRGQVVHSIKFDNPCGVAVAPDGSVWVAGCDSNKLWKF